MRDTMTDLFQITMEDLQIVEHVCRTDPGVIEQCVISGIPKEDMHKVYCDRECILFNFLLHYLLSGSMDHWV
jgi:Cu2+-containing amine oxidase